MILNLTQLKSGKSGVVVEIKGGHGLIRRLHSLGIREGRKITKLSSHFWRGPITIKAGHTQVAIGFGMAIKVSVEINPHTRISGVRIKEKG